jgi:hypothetical protein
MYNAHTKGDTRRVATRRHWERGGAAAIVAVLLGGGVLLGMSALAIDVSSIWYERRQLQNGADAASLALAAECAKSDANCSPTSPVIANYSNLNVSDGSTSNDGVCGRFPVGYTSAGVPGCDSATDGPAEQNAATEDLAECLPLPSWLQGTGSSIPYVEVKTGTSTGGGAPTLLPGIFSKAITGSDNPHVSACARAAWGPPAGFTGSLPLAISICEFQSYTGSDVLNGIPGAAVDPPSGTWPGYGGAGQPAWPPAYAGWENQPLHELMVMTHSTAGTNCDYKGKDTDGGFGWLDDGTNCTTTVSTTNGVDYWAEIKTGNSVPGSCKSVIEAYYGKTLLVPIFDCIQTSFSAPTGAPSGDCTSSGGGGAKSWYHVLGFATFYLSGNKLDNTVAQNSLVSGLTPCTDALPDGPEDNPWTGNSGRCLAGWFVSGTLSSPTIAPGGGTGDLGTVAIAPAG